MLIASFKNRGLLQLCHAYRMPDHRQSLDAAIEEDDLPAVAALLNEDHRPTTEDFVLAIEQKSTPILDLLLQLGYDINAPVRSDYPPPLA